MKRILALLLCVLAVNLSVSAVQSTVALSFLERSALSSPSYTGRTEDFFVNPAALPLIPHDTVWKLSAHIGEAYDWAIWGKEKSSHIQNLTQEVQGMVVTGNMAFSAKFSNALSSRHPAADGSPLFNIHSGIDIEIDLGFTVQDNFSFGLRLGGGNSLARMEKNVDGYLSVVQNALFSPYSKVDGSERFTALFGMVFHTENMNVGVTVDRLLSDGKTASPFLSRVLGNTTLSLSFSGEKYDAGGDLSLFVPRAGVSLRGMGSSGERAVEASGDVTLQLLKTTYLDGGVKYLYRVDEDGIGRYLTFSLQGVLENYSLSLNLTFDTSADSAIDIMPSIAFSYSG